MDIKSELLKVAAVYWQLAVQWTPKLVMGIVIILLFWFISVQARNLVANRLKSSMDDPLLARFLSRMAKWVLVILGFVLALKVMGMGDIAGSLVAGAGVSAFIIGFAFKDIGENFLAGILLAFNRPFRVGHIIETGGQTGKVVALDLRTTQIKTFDGKDVFIPSSALIKNPLINYTIDGFLRQEFVIAVDYQTNISTAMNAILNALTSINGILQEEKQPSITVSSLNSSSIGLKVFYWLDTFDLAISGAQVRTEAIQNSLNALAAANVYMPADIMEIKNYGDEKVQVTTS